MADSKIAIEIELESGQVVKGLGRIERRVDNTNKKLKRAFSPRLFTGFVKGAARAATSIAAIGTAFVGAAAAGFTFSRAIAASTAQQDAVNQLNQSLKAAGTFSEESSNQIQQFAKNLQTVTTVGDETTLQLVALAQNFTESAEQAQELTEAAINLSAATGQSLDGAVVQLGKTFSGLQGEIGESVPAIRALTAEQLKAGAAIDLVSKRFAGFAAAQRQTFSGSIAALSNSFGDFLEVIGDAVTTSPALIEVVGFLSDKFGQLASSIKSVGDAGDPFGELLVSTIRFGKALNDFVIAPIEVTSRIVGLAFKRISDNINALIGSIQPLLQRLGSLLNTEISLPDGGIFGSATELLFGVDIATFQEETRASVSEGFGTLLTELENVAVKGLESGKKIGRGIAVGVSEGFSGGLPKVNEKLVELEREINKSLQGTVVAIIQQGVSSITQALVQGGNAFDAFKNVVFNILGDFAIQIGGLLVAQGLALQALAVSLATLNGAGAIAAGLALIALGGALKGLASGPGADAGGAIGATGGGGVATVAPVNDETEASETAGLSEQVEQRQGTVINLNVQNAVGLDSKETGVALAETLSEAFEQEGVEIRSGAFA